LEEVERSEDGKYWLITVGFTIPGQGRATTALFGADKPERAFKVITVDANTGDALSMKIRKP